jgi:hypothetical protein
MAVLIRAKRVDRKIRDLAKQNGETLTEKGGGRSPYRESAQAQRPRRPSWAGTAHRGNRRAPLTEMSISATTKSLATTSMGILVSTPPFLPSWYQEWLF